MRIHLLRRELVCWLVLTCALLGKVSAQQPGKANSVVQGRSPLPARVEHAPLLSLSYGSDSTEPFHRIVSVARASDGAILVAEASTSSMILFDSNGRFVRRVGGVGRGPADLTGIGTVGFAAGDTLFATTNSPASVSFFTRNGTLLRRVEVGSLDIPGLGARRQVMAVFASSVVVASMRPDTTARTLTGWVDSAQVVLVSLRGTGHRPIGTFPSVAMASHEGRPQPLWLGPQLAWGQSDSQLAIGFGATSSIELFDPTGRRLRQQTAPLPAVILDGDDREVFVEEWVTLWGGRSGSERAAAAARMRATAFANELPRFSQVLLSPDGSIWLRRPNAIDAASSGSLSGTPRAPSRWSVFTSSGDHAFDLELPAYFRASVVDGHFVLGVARDVDGVEEVRMFKVTRTADAPARH